MPLNQYRIFLSLYFLSRENNSTEGTLNGAKMSLKDAMNRLITLLNGSKGGEVSIEGEQRFNAFSSKLSSLKSTIKITCVEENVKGFRNDVHAVSYAKNGSTYTVSVHPLPAGHFVACAISVIRNGPHKTPIHANGFVKALQRILVQDVLCQSPVDGMLIERVNSALGPVAEEGTSIASIEYIDNESESFCAPVFATKKFKFDAVGLSDIPGEGHYVCGYEVCHEDDIINRFNSYSICSSLTSFLERVFPPLPPSCVQIGFSLVNVTLPTNDPNHHRSAQYSQ